MHPIFQNWRYFALYMAGWIPLGAILGLLISGTADLSKLETAVITAPVTTVLAFVCLSPWYTCRSLPLRSMRVGLLGQHLLAGIVVGGAVLLLARLTASAFTSVMPDLNQRFRSATPVLTAIVTMLYLLSIALHYVVIEAQTSRRSELLAREAQLKALKAQVNPHFLFNSLNSISALTAIDPVRARAMCIRLADFLRVSLRLGERGAIPFGEEMKLTRMYLDVEQVRFGTRLRLAADVDDACSECLIPALLIQPLVENAVKHGIALIDAGGEISLYARRERDSLRFTIENPFDPDAPASRSGIGLENVRQRLEARYGSAARMKIDVGDRLYRVTLTLPMRVS
jgi:two-component system, LytTR family, sensor histidine kinase AlgZ